MEEPFVIAGVSLLRTSNPLPEQYSNPGRIASMTVLAGGNSHWRFAGFTGCKAAECSDVATARRTGGSDRRS